jgi:hypothetical protein
MREESLQVGAIGAKIEVLIVEFDNAANADAPVDLSSASTLSIRLKRPDNTTVSRTGIISTNGTDGKMHMLTIDGDINIEGTYYIQGKVIFAGWDGYSSVGKFEVNDNL